MRNLYFRLMVGIIILAAPIAWSLPPTAISVLRTVKTAKSTDVDSYFDANRLFMMVYNNGNVAYDNSSVYGRQDGLYYPYSGYPSFPGIKTVVYAAGIFMGGKVDGEIRIAAAEYSTEYVPGPMAGGTFQPDQPFFHVYKIDRNSGPGDPDYDQWPASEGAPVDQLGQPLLLGDQMLWAVFNDADFSHHTNGCGRTDPLGIEVQQTVWGSDLPGEQTVVYIKYKLYNKGTNPIDSFFISFWADPDLGDASNDLVGCDTTSDIFFAYNSGPDAIYNPDTPVWGVKLISGPVVPSEGDTAMFDGQPMPGFKNLGMFSFGRYINNTDPQNEQETFNYMKGLARDGSPNVDPLGHETRFPYSGDPVNGTGWLDEAPSDKRLMASFGNLHLDPGDSQQVVLKLVAYAAEDLSAAVTELKQALDSAAVVVNAPVFVDCDSASVSVNDYQQLGEVYFLDQTNQHWLARYNWGGDFFGGSADYGYRFFGSSIHPETNPGAFHGVEVRFSQVQKQKAYRYVRGGNPNYGYDGYYEVPFTVWDTDNNRQLNAAFVENLGSPCFDNTWSPCDNGQDGREYLIIFNSSYSGDDPSNSPIDYQNLNFQIDANLLDIQYIFWPALRSGHSLSEIVDGQKLVFRKQLLNQNGIAGDVVIKLNESGTSQQRLDIESHSSGSSILKFEIPVSSPFSVAPKGVLFDTSISAKTYVYFRPPFPGYCEDYLSVVDVMSGLEKARVRLVGLPEGTISAKVEIDPDTMYVYQAHAGSPMDAEIRVGDFYYDEHLLQDVNLSTLLINDSIVPTTAAIVPSYPGFYGEVLETVFPNRGFILGYGPLWGDHDSTYTVSGQFVDGSPFNVAGIVTLIGIHSGDANGDGEVDIADVVHLIAYIFSGGPAPNPLAAGDADCDGVITIADAVYLITYIFSHGPQPCAGR